MNSRPDLSDEEIEKLLALHRRLGVWLRDWLLDAGNAYDYIRVIAMLFLVGWLIVFWIHSHAVATAIPARTPRIAKVVPNPPQPLPEMHVTLQTGVKTQGDPRRRYPGD